MLFTQMFAPQKSTALPMGGGTSARRDGITSTTQVQKEAEKPLYYFALNITMHHNYNKNKGSCDNSSGLKCANCINEFLNMLTLAE